MTHWPLEIPEVRDLRVRALCGETVPPEIVVRLLEDHEDELEGGKAENQDLEGEIEELHLEHEETIAELGLAERRLKAWRKHVEALVMALAPCALCKKPATRCSPKEARCLCDECAEAQGWRPIAAAGEMGIVGEAVELPYAAALRPLLHAWKPGMDAALLEEEEEK